MSSVTRLEADVVKTVNVSMDTITTRFISVENTSKGGKPFEIVAWMQYFAFNVLGPLLYGERHGFIEEDMFSKPFRTQSKTIK